jgi:putative restriction endonuclease
MDADTLLTRLSCLRRFTSGGLRAPHKPLLILFALGRLKHGRDDAISYCDADAILALLLRIYGPTGTRARTADPFGRLESDGIWRIQGDRCSLFDRGGNLRPAVLRQRM